MVEPELQLETLVDELDVPYEILLLKNAGKTDNERKGDEDGGEDEEGKNRKHLQVWSDYINHKLAELAKDPENESKVSSLLFLYYRRSLVFSKDLEIWLVFINYYIQIVDNNILQLKKDNRDMARSEINKINNHFQNKLTSNHNIDSLDYWNAYIDFLVKFQENISFDYIWHIVNLSLKNLKIKTNHLKIWKKIIPLAKNNSLELSFEIYHSYFIFLKNSITYDIEIIYNDPDLPNLLDVYDTLIDSITSNNIIVFTNDLFVQFVHPSILIKISKSELDLYNKFFEKIIELLIKYPQNVELESIFNKLYSEILDKFNDQQSKFIIQYSNYLIKVDNFDKCIDILESNLNKSLTIKDFTLIFDKLTNNLESKLLQLSEENEDLMNKYMNKLDDLLNKRLILINDVKIRQNFNSPNNWIERIKIMKDLKYSNKEIGDCYSNIIININFKKISNDEKLNLCKIWIDYAKFYYYEKNDLINCRRIFETAVKAPWTNFEQLEEIYIEWIKFDINEIKDLQSAYSISLKSITIPKSINEGTIDINDKDLSIQMRIFKSIRLWSLYLDLVENYYMNKKEKSRSDIDIDKNINLICEKYEECIELKVINGILLINYCLFLEENGLIKKSFQIFEIGLKLFNGESKSLIYLIYLNKVLKYFNKLNLNYEIIREIFENGLDYFLNDDNKNEENIIKFLEVYSQWEKENGSSIKSLKILRNGIKIINKQSNKLIIYKLLILNTIEIKNLQDSIEIFIEAINNLSFQLNEIFDQIVKLFIEIELKLGRVDEARQTLNYAVENLMKFNKSDKTKKEAWEFFKFFELKNGNESTFKEMLKFKIYLENLYPYGEHIGENHLGEVNDETGVKRKDDVGFVISSNSIQGIETVDEVKEGANEAAELNNDAISLNMSSDDDSDSEKA